MLINYDKDQNRTLHYIPPSYFDTGWKKPLLSDTQLKKIAKDIRASGRELLWFWSVALVATVLSALMIATGEIISKLAGILTLFLFFVIALELHSDRKEILTGNIGK